MSQACTDIARSNVQELFIVPETVRGEIELQNVTCHYEPGRNVVENVSFVVPQRIRAEEKAGESAFFLRVRQPEKTARSFDLLLGDNLAGRKDFIAQNGWKYLELADLS